MFQMDVLLTAAVVDDPEKLVPKLLQKKKGYIKWCHFSATSTCTETFETQ